MQNVRGTAYLLAALGVVAWCFSLVWKPAAPPKYRGLEVVRERLPIVLSGYERGDENQFSEPVLKALAAADIVSFPYRGGRDGFEVTLIGGTDRSALHDPRSCLVGAGWRIENDHTEPLPGTDVEARVCTATGGSDGVDYEIIYLYVVGDRIINHVTQIRTQMLLSALVGRKGTPVCFVRFQRPVPRGGGDDPEEAKRFRAFSGEMWNTLKIKGSI